MTVLAQPPIATDEKMILDGVSWETYEHLSSDFANRPSIRLTYDKGTLEIMVVSYGHERLKSIIGDLVVRLAFELDIDYEAAGSTTFKREGLGAGFEGDESFYFSHLAQIRQRSELDLAQDPPPDLVIEIDISSPSRSKFPIFAALGIPEIWRFHENHLLIYSLTDGEYSEAQSSAFLTGLTASDVTNLVEAREQMPPNAWQRKVTDYARQIRARGK
jgi:Uma2 family endonuclease